jgi:hypothetical protein
MKKFKNLKFTFARFSEKALLRLIIIFKSLYGHRQLYP